MNEHFVVGQLKHAVALVALLNVLRKMKFHSQQERILLAECLRDVADGVEHGVQ